MMLELKNLSAGYSHRQILSHMNLVFRPGTLYTIIGKNGSGKSTLLKCCSGLLTPSEGAVLLDGKELSGYSSGERAKKISWLSQNTVTPNITVERMLAHSRFPYLGHSRKLSQNDLDIICRAMKVMRIEKFRTTPMKQLSGGECQRVYLAMQLAQDTPVMLLDEPTTFLDIEYQLSLMELLLQLKQSGKTIIMVLHDLEQALRYSDQLIALDDQHNYNIGTPEEFLSSGLLSRIFHVDIRRSEYQMELQFFP